MIKNAMSMVLIRSQSRRTAAVHREECLFVRRKLLPMARPYTYGPDSATACLARPSLLATVHSAATRLRRKPSCRQTLPRRVSLAGSRPTCLQLAYSRPNHTTSNAAVRKEVAIGVRPPYAEPLPRPLQKVWVLMQEFVLQVTFYMNVLKVEVSSAFLEGGI
jgi:hypothetical protein